MHEIPLIVLGTAVLLLGVALLLPVANRLRIPYTVLLALVGIAVGSVLLGLGSPGDWGLLGDVVTAVDRLNLTGDALFYVFLPTLVFESALGINVHRLAEDLVPILTLAIVGFLISMMIVAVALGLATNLAFVACLLIAAIVSATDPVAVIALFKDLGAPRRLATLVEGESLFNDATAIVSFGLLSAMLISGETPDAVTAIGRFLGVFLGGVATGYVAALAICAVIGPMRDQVTVEVTLTACLAYLVFILAEHYLHVSGVMAVVTAALVVGSHGRTKLSPRAWQALAVIWQHLAFWATSLIFVLVGLLVPSLLFDVTGADLWLLAVLVVSALIARAVILHGLLPLLSRLGWSHPVAGTYRMIMLWGGLRGAVSLALALIVLEAPGIDEEVRRVVVVLVTGFVLFTLFVEATTIKPLMTLFDLGRLAPSEQSLRKRAMALTLSHVRRAIDRTAKAFGADAGQRRELIENYERRLAALEGEQRGETPMSEAERLRIGLEAIGRHERRVYTRYYDDGVVTSGIAGRLLAEVERLIDGARASGLAGYNRAVAHGLAFRPMTRLALWAQHRLNLEAPLAKALESRFEVLMAMESALDELLDYSRDTLVPLLGEAMEGSLLPTIEARRAATRRGLDALRLQYPEYEAALRRRLLERVDLRLEQNDLRNLLEEEALSREVYQDLSREMSARAAALDKRPRLDLGLAPSELLAKVPLFARLSTPRHVQIAKLLHPRFALPGEHLVRKGEMADAMYFLASGAAEVALPGGAIRLGSGDFFGEIALLKEMPRTADVVALGYCRCLVLRAADFRRLMAEDKDLHATITDVAERRLGELEGARAG